MTSDDYQVRNIYRYTRKTFKKDRIPHDDDVPCDNASLGQSPQVSPRNEAINVDPGGCSCDIDQESEIASLLHKKCPVIALAQQQMERLLQETDRIMCTNTRCRSFYGVWCMLKDFLQAQDGKTRFIIMLLIALGFFIGVLIGAGSCGSYLGQFNSPIFTCIDNYFMPDSFHNVKDSFRSIV